MKKILVSVVIAVYNAEETLLHALQSVVQQTHSDLEIILVDDGSQDRSRKIARDFLNASGVEFTLIENEKNCGLTKSLNSGIRMAKGAYIARLDADDWWEADKLEKQLLFLKDNPDYVILGTNYVSHDGRTGKTSLVEKPETDQMVRSMLLQTTPFTHSSIIFRATLGLEYDEKYDTTQDYDLYRQILFFGKGANLSEALTHKLTKREQNISTQRWRRQVWNRVRIRSRIFQEYPHQLWDYRFFLFDFFLLLLPSGVKRLKNVLFT